MFFDEISLGSEVILCAKTLTIDSGKNSKAVKLIFQ